MKTTALIAEDEALLAANLQAELLRLWPDLEIVASVGDGETATEQALILQPDMLFLDIRMPGMTGLACAEALTEDWPEDGKRFPLIVFVTAYDQYALQAFERSAFDYVLKPVQTERLAKTCARLQERLLDRKPPRAAVASLDAVVEQMRELLAAGQPESSRGMPAAAPLRVIQASAGNTITMVPIDDILFFEAADKYIRVVTAAREHLIRLSLRELLPQLDPQRFWQIHRGAVVRCEAIETAQRDDAGKLTLTLRGNPTRLVVSRLYAHLFRGM
ncbi:LytR/AlgR family response regulator transcription factor [Paraburkholderia bryophila]|uniref:LytTR family two component transcriptional regulator n=1 Tax=Paraburkholderia bryophila TaxID=420952 RepID=A0A329CP95_9BURK|nr:LytTR family DNA-binding domain-containing protein [Paraburkholderia bryophila]RAS35521.1 LytTR family two component transcriptional regulator [Paraburkholderia bryophila]